MSYEQARQSLKNDGWVPLPLDTPRDVDEFTELFTSKNTELETCSKKRCTARYQRGAEHIRVWLAVNASDLLGAKVESANYIGGTLPTKLISSEGNNNTPTPQRPNVAANEPYPGYSLLTEEDIQRCVLSGRWYFHAASMRDQGESPDLIYQNLMALTKLPGYNHPPTDMEQIINMVIQAFPGESPAMITDKMMTSCKRVVAKHRIENNPFDWTGMGI